MLVWSKNLFQRRAVTYLVIFTSAIAICAGMIAPLPSAPSRSLAMTSSPQIQKLIERQARAWENADSAAVVGDFAEEALFIVPGSVFEGRSAIKAAAEDYFSQFSQTKVTIERIVAHDNEGAVEWRWSDRNNQTGTASAADDAIIFELRNGKIVYWREYIDTQSPSQTVSLSSGSPTS